MGEPRTTRSLHRLLFRVLALLALVGVFGLATLFCALWVERKTALTLPAPTGPFAVGRGIGDWTDEHTPDTLASVAGANRELLVWIWYPAPARPPSAAEDDYVPEYVRKAVARDRVPALFKLLTRDLTKVHGHSRANAPVLSQSRSYPVLLMRAGASAEVWNYSTLAEDLASHGYIVIGFDAPYRTNLVAFPDGREITRLPANNPERCLEVTGVERDRCAEKCLAAWASDMSFVLDRLQQLNSSDASGQFTGKLDISRVGAFGHSFGGAAALKFCREDSRCRAVIDVDGAPHGDVIQAGVNRPCMLLLSDHSRESDPQAHQIMANLQSIYDQTPADEKSFVEIRGANHFLFSDDGALLKSHILMHTLRTFGVVRMDGRRQLAITGYCLRTFFDAYLKSPNNSAVRFTSPLYPEIQTIK